MSAGPVVVRAAAALACAVLALALAGCGPAPRPFVQPSGCPSEGIVRVASATELARALSDAKAGDAVVMTAGVYTGHFAITERSGTDAAPLTLCGSSAAVLDGGDTSSGYALHLDGASHWRLLGFTARNAQKGIVLDGSSHIELRGLTVESVGQEGIHLRSDSSDNTVAESTVSDTGLRDPQFGEGLYVGSSQGNWCVYSDCRPDASDRNVLIDNTIRGTTAEAIDIKEGTSAGLIQDNRIDGSGTTAVDSLIDVKGNDWTVDGTTGVSSPRSGAQVHSLVAGWGQRNTFATNTFDVRANGYAIEIATAARGAGNTVACDNVALLEGVPSTAQRTNVACR